MMTVRSLMCTVKRYDMCVSADAFAIIDSYYTS